MRSNSGSYDNIATVAYNRVENWCNFPSRETSNGVHNQNREINYLSVSIISVSVLNEVCASGLELQNWFTFFSIIWHYTRILLLSIYNLSMFDAFNFLTDPGINTKFGSQIVFCEFRNQLMFNGFDWPLDLFFLFINT